MPSICNNSSFSIWQLWCHSVWLLWRLYICASIQNQWYLVQSTMKPRYSAFFLLVLFCKRVSGFFTIGLTNTRVHIMRCGCVRSAPRMPLRYMMVCFMVCTCYGRYGSLLSSELAHWLALRLFAVYLCLYIVLQLCAFILTRPY